MERPNSYIDRGHKAEIFAKKYLIAQKLRHQHSNYRCQYGEIDLIMHDQHCVVFVEVKYRQTTSYANAKAALSWAQQQRLRKTAHHYLKTKRQQHWPCRFDVIAIDGDFRQPQIDWIQNAF